MTLVADDTTALLARLRGPEVRAAATRLLGQEPADIDLERTHFAQRRPLRLSLAARLSSGRTVPLLAEYCPDDPHGHAQRTLASLGKSRNGQKAGPGSPVIAVAEGAGLALRRPGFDARLPGLRLLHDAAFARSAVETATGRDPGPVSIELVAHRLGKRAVLRIILADRLIYARLRAIKSGEGATRLARHRALWSVLTDRAGLRIPEPLGVLPDLGVSLFAALAGDPPAFGSRDCAAIARAIDALQALDPEGLPRHTGADEARLLAGWLDTCRTWRPDISRQIGSGLLRTLRALEQTRTAPRPCHRDLHEKQILIAGGVAGFLDLDTLCLSDPALDAGNLSAHLFLAGQDEAPLRALLDQPGLDLWRRAALFRLAMIYAVTSTPDAVLLRLIDEASSDAGH